MFFKAAFLDIEICTPGLDAAETALVVTAPIHSTSF
jgi:hypothetical protein